MNREDVIVAPFSGDVGRAYRSADVFAFPSLEEGGPLVVYEAMGHGLASLVSPMGAGRGVRDGVEGMVMDPYAVDEWAAALSRMERDEELRKEMGRVGRERAMEFTWERVGAQRREEVVKRLGRAGRESGRATEEASPVNGAVSVDAMRAS
ncbi:MAG: glycosyltransferase family 4 protein [Phycisphaerales bacterium]